MFREHLLILSGGAVSRTHELAIIEQGWHLLTATEMMDLLANYVHYSPDVVLVWGAWSEGQTAVTHLRSVHAHPLLLLPEPVSPVELIRTISEAVAHERNLWMAKQLRRLQNNHQLLSCGD